MLFASRFATWFAMCPNIRTYTLYARLYVRFIRVDNAYQGARNAKNEKCILRYFAFCAPFFAFRISRPGWRSQFFHGSNKTQNLPEMRKVYGECFIFCGVFRKNIRKMRNTKSV